MEKERKTFSKTFDEIIESKPYADPSEKQDDYAFHTSRAMLAFVHGKLEYRMGDPRDHATWLHEDFGMDKTTFEATDRGYMKEMHDKTNPYMQCVLYRGMDFAVTAVTKPMLKQLFDIAKERFHGLPLSIWVGCEIGKIGEIWPPKEWLGDWQVMDSGEYVELPAIRTREDMMRVREETTMTPRRQMARFQPMVGRKDGKGMTGTPTVRETLTLIEISNRYLERLKRGCAAKTNINGSALGTSMETIVVYNETQPIGMDFVEGYVDYELANPITDHAPLPYPLKAWLRKHDGGHGLPEVFLLYDAPIEGPFHTPTAIRIDPETGWHVHEP